MSSAVGSVAVTPVGAPVRRTLPRSFISTDMTGILRSAAAVRANSAPTAGQIKTRASVSPRKKRKSPQGYVGFRGAPLPAINAAREDTIAGKPLGSAHDTA